MSDVSYKIVRFDETNGQLTLKYRDMYTVVDLPIDINGNVPSGDALRDYLRGFVPTWHYDRLELFANGINNADEIRNLVESDDVPENVIDESYLEVPYVPTDFSIVDEMLRLAGIKAGDKFIDLGSGDGRLVIAAAKLGAISTGVEKEPTRITLARNNAIAENVSATFIQDDLLTFDLNGFDVITMFLNDLTIDYIGLKVSDLPSGTRIVSNTFCFSWWKPTQISIIDKTKIYLWIVE